MRHKIGLIVITAIFIALFIGIRSGFSASCADVKNIHFASGVTITSATMVAATATVPEHCDVRGNILPEIGFAVKLPTQWNGRFYMAGNHLFGGDIDHAAVNVGLKKGYAAAGTDMGHDSKKEPGLTAFYHNRQKEIDFFYRATHKTAVTAKEIISAFYGHAPAFSYYVGSSTGGRQGLMEAQRYPTDFNGILVGMPTAICMAIQSVWYLQALVNPAPVGLGPVPLKNKITRFEKIPLLEKAVYDKCDGIDGLVDGIIDDPRECTFNPEKDLPLCAGDVDAPDCFTTTQVQALKKVYGSVISKGEPICEKLCPGGETYLGRAYIGLGTDPPPVYGLSVDTFRYLLFKKDNPDYDFVRDFNFDTDPPKLEFIKGFYDAFDPELFPFMNSGGKIILSHGWIDSSHQPLLTVKYYEEVLDFMGSKANDFFRLYMVPGVYRVPVEVEGPGGLGHGRATDTFDLFGPLVNWVEKGIAPESIVASHITDGKIDRTRPLCPYPKRARYTGSGSIDDAANFNCVEPTR